jgi:TRAP-type transport system periplasmic protein
MRLLAACAVAAMVFGAAGAEAQTTLRFAHTQPPSDTHHLATVFFADRLKELTGGEIEVSIHPAGELGSDPALLEGVRLGTIDFAQTGNPYYTRFQPELNVLDLPYLFEDYDHVYAVIDGEIGAELLAGLEDDGMKGIAFWEIGFRKITNGVRPIRTLRTCAA